jgi:CHAT domain-containing protein/tetratricopeptide (TPR) repeat protein
MAHRDQGSLNDNQSDSDSPSPPLVITVRRQQNIAFYDLAEVEPLIQNIQIEFDENLLAHILNELQVITDSLNRLHAAQYDAPREGERFREETTARFTRLGRVIYEQLLPGPIQQVLTDHPGANLFFRLEDSLLEVPWELTFDGRQFLSNRFHIGRQVITSLPFHKTPDDRLSRSRQNPPRLLIISDPKESLPAAVEETESLIDALDLHTHLEVEIIGGKRATKLEVLSALSEFEIVHFAGHSRFDHTDSGKSGWVLHDGILTSAEISKISNPPLLVFSNSCQSAATQRWDNPHSFGQASLGIGSSFLLAGVRHYVGALWVIHDAGSAMFASAFYQRLLQGGTVGESLIDAKNADLGLTPVAALMAASYVHYGRPDDKIIGHAGMQAQTPGSAVKIAGGGSFQDKPGTSKFERKQLKRLGLAALVVILLLVGFAVLHFQFHPSSKDPIAAEYQKGVEAYRKRSIPKALAIFQKLTQREDNKSGQGFGDLAEIYLEAGATEKARKVLADAAGKTICSTLTHMIKGHLALQEGNQSEAEKAYIQALVMDNGLPEQTAEAFNALGSLYFLAGKKENALDLFSKALARQQTNPGTLFNLGFIAYLDGHQARAKDLMAKVVDLHPDDELALSFLESTLTGATPDGQRPVLFNTSGEAILIGPFYLRGGTVKRLGYEWVFAHMLTRMLVDTGMTRQYTFRVATPFDVPNGYSQSSDATAMKHMMQGLSQPLRARTAFFGDLQLFPHVAYANIEAMDVASGTIIRSINIKAEDPQKLHKLAEGLKDEIPGLFVKGAESGPR